jgi:hypothetical protein
MAKPYLPDQNMTIYDFMPLDGDPSEEERQRIEKENIEKRVLESRKQLEKIRERFSKYGRV